jgi:hypothetical protein
MLPLLAFIFLILAIPIAINTSSYMKKYLQYIPLLMLLAATSCLSEEPKTDDMDPQPPPHTVITIEGCEYFRFRSTHGYIHITHKGNCKNPIHCYVQPVSK